MLVTLEDEDSLTPYTHLYIYIMSYILRTCSLGSSPTAPTSEANGGSPSAPQRPAPSSLFPLPPFLALHLRFHGGDVSISFTPFLPSLSLPPSPVLYL